MQKFGCTLLLAALMSCSLNSSPSGDEKPRDDVNGSDGRDAAGSGEPSLAGRRPQVGPSKPGDAGQPHGGSGSPAKDAAVSSDSGASNGGAAPPAAADAGSGDPRRSDSGASDPSASSSSDAGPDREGGTSSADPDASQPSGGHGKKDDHGHAGKGGPGSDDAGSGDPGSADPGHAGSGAPGGGLSGNPLIDLIALLSGVITPNTIGQLVALLSQLVLDDDGIITVLTVLNESGACEPRGDSLCQPVCELLDEQSHSCRHNRSCRRAMHDACGD